MKNGLFILLGFILTVGCERIVDIEDPYPQEQFYCGSNSFYLGEWVSDSVRITTEIDSLPDTLIVNRFPGLTYALDLKCSDADKLYHLRYFNGSGVETREVYSTNFEQLADSVVIFDQTDSVRLTPSFSMRTESTSDSTFQLSYSRDLGSGQRSDYLIFLRRI
tara:strand:- start:1893 stop:2381 length:489 start_codon:yes stop_codon:yes gene_type:complete